MYIAREYIQKLAIDSSEYSKGQAYYEEGKISELKVKKYEDWLEVTGYIRESRGDYFSSIKICNKKILTHKCDCLVGFEQRGLCKHTVGLLLKFYNEWNIKSKREIRGEYYSKSALGYYEDQLVKEQEIEISNIGQSIKAAVRLVEIEARSFSLNLSIGENRFYVVKDLYEFTDNMRLGEIASYGKNLEFIHDINVFDETSRPIIQFIMDKVIEYNSILVHIGFFRGFSKADRRALPLNAKAFDEFFDIVKNSEVEMVIQGNITQVLCIEKNPELELRIDKEEECYILSSSMPNYIPLKSARYHYILTNDKLYRLNSDFAKYVFPILEQMYMAERTNENKQLEFNENLMKRFMLSSLNNIRQYIPLIMNEEVERIIKPEHAIIRSFFDMDQDGNIIGGIEIQYQDIIFNPYKMTNVEENKKLERVARDTPSEFKLSGILRR